MKLAHLFVGATILASGWPIIAVAGSDSDRARTMVKNAEADNVVLLAHVPSLQAVEDVVSDDCRKHADNSSDAAEFCRCGVSITMAIWRTGADPHLMGLLKTYVADPASMPAAGFAKYQGPELYSPVCKLAEQH